MEKRRITKPLKTFELLDVKNLKVEYTNGKKQFIAVNGISFSVKKNKTTALVGESGCGKTTTGMAILKLLPIKSGQILWRGKDLISLSPSEFRPFRKKIQIIFQNPDSSLNPKLSIKSSMREALELSHPKEKNMWNDIIADRFEKVGLDPSYLSRYPHEFSGGQLQRIGIARALCVEPVSSLDVSIQAQILNLLMDLQDQLGLSYLFISHDLSVVRHIAQEVAVMYRGTIKEMGKVDDVFSNPQSSYTQELLDSIPGNH